MNKRTEIINKLWKDLHNGADPLFYWSNDTETAYFYDEITDSIMSENGFSVSIEKPTEELTKNYIFDLIYKLEIKIKEYYFEHYNIELGYDY